MSTCGVLTCSITRQLGGPAGTIFDVRVLEERFTEPSSGLLWRTADSADGSANKPLLVAVHGLADAARVYRPLAERLAQRYDVLALDLPGHGKNPVRSRRRHQDVEMVEPLAATLSSWCTGERPVVLLGHSLGAMVAVRLARVLPGVVAVVVEEPPRPRLMSQARARAEAVVWLTRLGRMNLQDRIAHSSHAQDWPSAELHEWAKALGEVDLLTIARFAGFQDSLSSLLATLTCRAIVILGDGDESQTTAEDEAMLRQSAAGYATLEVHRLPGGGHSPRREAPEAFLKIMDGLAAQISS